MDDEGPTVYARGDSEPVPTQRDAQPQPWSCIDYVDFQHDTDDRPTRGSTAQRPAGEKHLSTRFGGLAGHDELREDNKGTCYEERTDGWGRKREKRCGEEDEKSLVIAGVGDEGTWTRNVRYTGKLTNRGWPGTAEGKMGTVGDYIILLAGHV